MGEAAGLVPACGGTEHPFTVNGRNWMYCYHPESQRHCYLDLDNNRPVWHRSFHPVWHPEFELAEPGLELVEIEDCYF